MPCASTVRVADPLNLPISAILPSFTATSPRNADMPEPSTTRPLRINKSYVIGFLPLFWSPSLLAASVARLPRLPIPGAHPAGLRLHRLLELPQHLVASGYGVIHRLLRSLTTLERLLHLFVDDVADLDQPSQPQSLRVTGH